MGVDVMLFKNLKDYKIEDVDVDDYESICGALLEVVKMLDELSRRIEDATEDRVSGTNLFEISTMLYDEVGNIEEQMEDDVDDVEED